MNDPIKNKTIPNFFDGFYDLDIERPRTLGKALLNLETAVENIKKVTLALRAASFDPAKCTYILDTYYAGDMGKPEVVPSQNGNYYYVLTMPELLDVEFALETLNIASGKIREKADKLRSKLWQLLPDFYRGHANPMPQPLTYDPQKPYPFSCVEGKLTRIQKARRLQKGSAIVLKAVLNRRQLAQNFIAECERTIKGHNLAAQENSKIGDYTDLSYFHKLKQKVKRLKSII